MSLVEQSLLERRRARFEEKAFAQRFLNSVTRVNDGQFGLQPVGCPTKAEFVAKDADGNYLDNSLNFAWWGWNAALDSVVIDLSVDLLDSSPGVEAQNAGITLGIEFAAERITAAGLKVAP